MKEVNLKIDKTLVAKVQIITKKKNPERNLDSYSSAVKEALFEFVKKNRRYLTKEDTFSQNTIKAETGA